MGTLLSSCCGGSAEESNLMPSPETRRHQQLEAAERRRLDNDTRGIKNSDSVRRHQQRTVDLERREKETAHMAGSPVLKWQAD